MESNDRLDEKTLEFVDWFMERKKEEIKNWQAKGKTKEYILQELGQKAADKYLGEGGKGNLGNAGKKFFGRAVFPYNMIQYSYYFS